MILEVDLAHIWKHSNTCKTRLFGVLERVPASRLFSIGGQTLANKPLKIDKDVRMGIKLKPDSGKHEEISDLKLWLCKDIEI